MVTPEMVARRLCFFTSITVRCLGADEAGMLDQVSFVLVLEKLWDAFKGGTQFLLCSINYILN